MLEQLQEELIAAMKTKDKATLIGLRNIIGKLKIKKIEKGTLLTNQECVQILQSLEKQLKDSILQYKKGGRDDLAKIEEFELKLLEKYLPEQLSTDEIRKKVQYSIKSIGAKSIQDIGQVMGAVMKELSGSANGNIVMKIVREELSILL